MICGLPCSGKTTLARRLELERSAVRLTPDEWIARIVGPAPGETALDAARDPTEAALWDLAGRLLSLGLDVILDFGFWSRAERERFRREAARLGARCELHLATAGRTELFERLARRNAAQPPGTFRIDPERLERWMAEFEPPDAAELGPER